jgi:hypothetical protein
MFAMMAIRLRHGDKSYSTIRRANTNKFCLSPVIMENIDGVFFQKSPRSDVTNPTNGGALPASSTSVNIIQGCVCTFKQPLVEELLVV